MREASADENDANEVDTRTATQRLLQDTFGVTDEGMRALTERAKARKARDALHPRTILKGRAGSHPPRDDG